MGIRTASPLLEPTVAGSLPRSRCAASPERAADGLASEPPVYLEGGRGTLRAVSAAAKKAEARHEDLVRSAELPVLSVDHGCVRPRSRSPRDVDPRRCRPGGPTGGPTPPRSRAGVPPGRSLRPLSRSRRQVGARGARLALSVRRCRDATTGLSRARCPSRCSGLCCHGSSFHPRRGPPGEPVGVKYASFEFSRHHGATVAFSALKHFRRE